MSAATRSSTSASSSDRRAPARDLLGGAGTALFAVWGLLLGELLVVVVLREPDFAASWEIVAGGLQLSPAGALLAAPAGLAGALLHECSIRADRRRRAGLSVLMLLFAAATAWSVATGRHFALPGARGGFSLAAGLSAFGLSWFCQPYLARFRGKAPLGFGLAAAFVILAVCLVNRFVLVRLYAPFHLALTLLALALAPVAALSLAAPGRRSRVSGLLAGLILAASAVRLAPASAALGRFDNFRLVLTDHAPLLGQAVRLAAWVAPPPPLDDVPMCLTGTQAAAGCAPAPLAGEGPSLSGRDIVLITIDALRADHLGAHGYPRPTTPNLDALAREGVVFEQAYCATPHTSYSLSSLLTGKFLRPLLLQGAGADSETLATYLTKYGYRTAAFYPPAVFFIDREQFAPFERSAFGFEYRKVEFMEGKGRVRQVDDYLASLPGAQRLLLWVHLFGPHEPYESHAEHPFGERDVDRYDSEVAAADRTVGELVQRVRARNPGAVVVLTADHGEEFGEHGGRYHGTSVYEEQVRVPLIVSAPGLLAPRRVREVVQTVDIVPTLLAGLRVPPSPRLRGRDLGPLLAGTRPDDPGVAFAETEESSLLAEGSHRLICARKLGACRLFDLARDPRQEVDVSATEPERFDRMRRTLRAFGASHGRFELAGLRAERTGGWPGPILRGLAGDADAAPELSALLDDADAEIRRKAAELLFELRRPETRPALRLALGRDEDPVVRNFCALGLTRMGEGAPLVEDLLRGTDVKWQRLAALALSETGDPRGLNLLLDWWRQGAKHDHARAIDLLAAFRRLRPKEAVWPLIQSLGEVRLRPAIAEALAAIGDDAARGPLAAALAAERQQTARKAIATAIVALDGNDELVRPLTRFLGVPDPLEDGLSMALRAGILDQLGGPDSKELRTLTRNSNVGALVPLLVPRGGNGAGLRVIVRGKADGTPGEIRVGKRLQPLQFDRKGKPLNTRKAPQIHDRDFAKLTLPGDGLVREVHAPLPAEVGGKAGRALEVVVFAERHVTLEALAVVPLADELPPPAPEPWSPEHAEPGSPGGAE